MRMTWEAVSKKRRRSLGATVLEDSCSMAFVKEKKAKELVLEVVRV